MTEKYIISNQDVPTHEADFTSSVGALWPPERASFGRIKGIYTGGIITGEGMLGVVIDQLQTQVSSHLENPTSEITRISLRAVLDEGVLRVVTPQLANVIEAVIPLQGTQKVFESAVLVYFGVNDTLRQSLPEELDIYKKNVMETLTLETRPYSELIDRVQKKEYQVGVISLPSDYQEKEKIVLQVAKLYERFGWSTEEVEQILTNPNNIAAAAVYGDEIVSAGIAEMAIVPIGQHFLRFAEITEAATADEHARNGLYTAVSATLLRELSNKSSRKTIFGGEIDFAFGECNGNAPGVLRTARIQGRTFAYEMGENFGFAGSGILHQHVPISGATRKTPYNDLFPAFIIRNKLYTLYGGEDE